ncbi:MAG: Hpt domain-containing protein [Planctomycetota bacterium]|jgi:HPt (histidine-containing phosphotransfer) domain-containing protein
MTESQPDPADLIPSQLVQQDASFAAIVEAFLQGIPRRIEELENALTEADFENLRRHAHQLKGSGGGYGYPALTDLTPAPPA